MLFRLESAAVDHLTGSQLRTFLKTGDELDRNSVGKRKILVREIDCFCQLEQNSSSGCSRQWNPNFGTLEERGQPGDDERSCGGLVGCIEGVAMKELPFEIRQSKQRIIISLNKQQSRTVFVLGALYIRDVRQDLVLESGELRRNILEIVRVPQVGFRRSQVQKKSLSLNRVRDRSL